jgi:hypothetical protein
MRTLSWQPFDRAVEQIASGAGDWNGTHGIPRGGLVVNDVDETGLSLAPIEHLSDNQVVGWVNKVEPRWWKAVEVPHASEWLVFPWEHSAAAEIDEQRCRASHR